MNDQISRQKLIEELEESTMINVYDPYRGEYADYIKLDTVRELIESQPPADQWIPVSEKLPDPVPLSEYGDDVKPVLVTYLAYMSGEPACDNSAVYCEDGIWRWWIDIAEVFAMEKVQVRITAWKYPEPYKGGEQHEHD